MNFAQSSRRRAVVLACSAAALVAAAPARASDDKSTWGSVMEVVGQGDESVKTIDYSERPKLVLPADRGDLPQPRERAPRPGGWPSDAAGVKRDNDQFARAPTAPPDAKKPSLLERVRGPRPAAAPGTDDEPGFFQRALLNRSRADVSDQTEPARRMLTEPPTGYRRPTQDLSKIRDSSGKKGSWWNPLTYMGGGGNDNDPVAQQGAGPAKPSGGAAGGGGFSSSLSSLVPGFMK